MSTCSNEHESLLRNPPPFAHQILLGVSGVDLKDSSSAGYILIFNHSTG